MSTLGPRVGTDCHLRYLHDIGDGENACIVIIKLLCIGYGVWHVTAQHSGVVANTDGGDEEFVLLT